MWIFPSVDIHLVRNAQPNTVDLHVFGLAGGVWTDASTVGNTVAFQIVAPVNGTPPAMPTLTGAAGNPPAAVTVTPSAAADGGNGRSWMVDVQISDGSGNTGHGLMRVTSHDDITALMSGDRGISMFAGDSDRQLTVFARFSDGSVEDVTAHPYLKYRVDPPTLATVNRDDGRITQTTEGLGTVYVTTWDDRFEIAVSLAVSPAIAGAGSVPATSEQLRRRTSKYSATLYVIAEGYQDRDRFFEHAHKVVDEWLRIQPYARLADQFDAIGVFLSSPDRRITIASRMDANHQAAGQRAIWEGDGFTGTVPSEYMVNRNTIFGLISGSRLSRPEMPKVDEARAPFAEFFVPEAERGLQPDPRHLGSFAADPRTGYISFVTRFLAGAGHTLKPADRIVFLVDDVIYGGASFNILGLEIDVPPISRPMTAISVGSQTVVDVAVVQEPLLDRNPVPNPDADRNLPTLDPKHTSSVVAHELGHTYNLGDEYENHRTTRYALDAADIDDAEIAENLQTDQTLRLGGGTKTLRDHPPAKVDVTKIRWNVHRVKKGTAVTSFVSQPAHNPVPTTLVLTVAADQVKRWNAGDRVFLRNTVAVHKTPRVAQRFTSIAVQIAATDPQHNTISVALPNQTFIQPLGTSLFLYMPQRTKSGDDLALIDPAVIKYLAANGPFPKPSQCGVSSQTDNDDVSPPDVQNFSAPSVSALTIGLYEGGLDYSCGIYRPTGRCKMRSESGTKTVLDKDLNPHRVPFIEDFCFVCSYMLVDLLDPSQHEWLDKSYPRDC